MRASSRRATASRCRGSGNRSGSGLLQAVQRRAVMRDRTDDDERRISVDVICLNEREVGTGRRRSVGLIDRRIRKIFVHEFVEVARIARIVLEELNGSRIDIVLDLFCGIRLTRCDRVDQERNTDGEHERGKRETDDRIDEHVAELTDARLAAPTRRSEE